MEANHEGTSGSGTVPEGEAGVGETVEIKIKTLDSQSYSVRVEKNVSLRKSLTLRVVCNRPGGIPCPFM